MLFFLKKFISFWLMPLPFCLILLVAGWFLTRPPRRGRLGRGLLTGAIALLLILGNSTISTWLVRPLETRYPPSPVWEAGGRPPSRLAACRYVIVLGGGHGDTPGLSANNRLSPPALARLAEGIRLLDALPGARLIVSGPAIANHPTHAAVLAEAASGLGVAADRIIRIERARDTEDESHAVKAIVGDAPVALVTSAWHMPRAAALFRAAGVNTLPCPADYSVRPNPEVHWEDFGWSPDALIRSTLAVHERLGLAWLRLRGRI